MSLTRLSLLLLTSTLAAFQVLLATSTSPGVQISRFGPYSIVAPIDDEVVFECETSLVPDRFEWSHRKQQQNARFKYLKPGKQSQSNGLHNITNENAISKLRVFVRAETLGEYRCVGWFGPLAVTSTTARLELASIRLAENSTAREASTLHWRVNAGNTLLLPCEWLLSKPPPTWSFYHNGQELPQVVSAVNGTLVLAQVTAARNGMYTCVATNTVLGMDVALPRAIELHVIADNAAKEAPRFLAEQQRQLTANAGDSSALLLCPAVGMPPPTIVWSSPSAASALHANRTRQLPYGLEILNVQAQDAGTYICYVDNGVRPPLEHFIELTVQQPPRIVREPSANLTNEGDTLQLECTATGVPRPEIYWLLNGEHSVHDSEAQVQAATGSLLLRHVQKRHAGYVQCFARNALGEHSAGTLLQVNPKQIQQASEPKPAAGRTPRPPHGRKPTQMVPPSAPNVTRLTDESVMLRWHVPRNDGLPIQFFKVQYRQLDAGKRRNWQTDNDIIPYGRPKWSSQQGKRFTASVANLKPQRSYRFRILAVYSNNDNKESTGSARFFLQRGAALEPLPVPELLPIEQQSETSVGLHWRLASPAAEQLISGYYAYYRPSSSAGEYDTVTIEGAQLRSFRIATLDADTIYEFKLQSFSAESASEFSAIKQGRTLKSRISTTQPPPAHTLDTTTPGHNETFSMKPLLSYSIAGVVLAALLLISGCWCVYRRKRGGDGDANKPHLAELRENFVACTPNKTRSHHIHITLNPLAQHEEKGANTAQDNELAYFQRQSAEPTNHNFNGRMSSSSLRRSQRAASGGNNNNLNTPPENALADHGRLQPNSNKPPRVILKRQRLSSRSDNLSTGSLNSVGV